MEEQRFRNYRVLERLGRSGSGDLYRVQPEEGTQQLLLQQLPLAISVEKLAQDLRWTARPVASLGRPAVSRIVSSGESDGGNLYLVFENAAGQPVQALIPGAPEKLAPAAALSLAGQVAHVLERGLKAGVIHKLLLPHYVFVQDGQPPTVLGLDLPATVADSLRPLLPEEELVYLSPEQRQGNVIDGRSNIYSLGALLYSLLTGEPPLSAKPGDQSHIPLAERRPDLSQPTIRLVETCLQPNSWMRFQTFEALRNAIDQAAAVEAPSETAAALTHPVAPPATRRRPRLRTSLAPLLVVAILFLVAAAVALGGGAWLLFGGGALDEMAGVDVSTPTPTRLAPLEGSGPGSLSGSPTVPPGPTPTLRATSTPEGDAAGGAAVDAVATPTRDARPTGTRVVDDELIGNNGDNGSDAEATATPTSPPRASTPRPTLEPTIVVFRPTATSTSAPTLAPTATQQAPLPPPPPPAATPAPTTEPLPTATHPAPATQPPPTPTPPLPTTS